MAEELSESLLKFNQPVSLGSRKQEVTVSEYFGLQLESSPSGGGYLHLTSLQRFFTISPTSFTIFHLFSSLGWVVRLVINPVHSQFRSGLPTWEDDSLTNCLSDLTLSFLECFAP